MFERFIGSLVTLASVASMVDFVIVCLFYNRHLERRFQNRRPSSHQFFIRFSAADILVLAASTACVWIWASVFRRLGVFSSFEQALYFSTVSFSTAGYGDIVVDKGWRIFSGNVAVNGVIAFGMFTAFLFEVIRNFSRRQPQ